MLCTYTNDYANTGGPQKPSLYQSWSNTYPEEFYCFTGLLITDVHEYSLISKYWEVLVKKHTLTRFVGTQLYGWKTIQTTDVISEKF